MDTFKREDIETAAPASTAPESEQTNAVDDQAESTAQDAGTAETATAENAADPNSEQSTPPAKDEAQPSRARDRIEDLVAERNALRQYGEHQARVIEQLLAKQGTPPAASAAAPAAQRPAETATDDDAPPTLEQFEFDAVKHAKAQADWLQRQVDKRVESALARRQAEQGVQTARQTFEERTAAFKAATPDFDAVISNPALPALAQNTAALIVQSEIGPNLVYHLAKHPEVAARIARMPSDRQAMAIGRIEAELEAAAKAKKPSPSTTANQTKAPPPPTPIPSGSGPGKDISAMTMDEFVAAERAKLVQRRASRQGGRR